MKCPYNEEHTFDDVKNACIDCGAPPDLYKTSDEIQIDDFTGAPFRIITKEETASEIMEELHSQKPEVLAFDVETTGLDIVADLPHGFSVSDGKMSYYFVNGAGIAAAKVFNKITNNGFTKIVAHNLKFDLHFIKKWGVSVNKKQACDTLLMAHMVDENQDLGLKLLSEAWLGIYNLPSFGDLQLAAKKYLGKNKNEVDVFDVPLGTLGCYAARDTYLTWQLFIILRERLDELSDSRLNNLKYLEEEVIPFLYLLQEMEEHGMYVSEDKWQEAYDYFSKNHNKAVSEWETITENIIIKLKPAAFFLEPFTIMSENGPEILQHLAVQEVVNRLLLVDKTEPWIAEASEFEQNLWVNEKIKRGKKIVGMAFPELAGSDKAWKHMQAAEYQTAPHNYNSTDQVGNILFSPKKLGGMGLKPTATTDSGKPSLDGINISRLMRTYQKNEAAYKILSLMTEISDSRKMLTTYLKPLKESVDINGFVHAGLNQTGTKTGRLSSSKPLNLQNQPSVGERGKMIRSIFTAPPGHYVLVCDFSQLELRLLAHYSKSSKLINLFKENGDPHALTAKLAGVERHVGKTINFAWAYGAWWLTIATALEKQGYERPSKEEASKWLMDFDSAYPELVQWKKDVITYARKLKGIRTIAGRWRRLENINSFNKKEAGRAERQAVNAIIQGSAGDIMERAMLSLVPWLAWFRAKLVMQVHDEIVLYVPNEVKPEDINPKVKEVMEGAGEYYGLTVPLLAEPNTGASWYEAK